MKGYEEEITITAELGILLSVVFN